MQTQKLGFPNISIKLFQDYNAWLENRFLELGATFVCLTMRDGIYGNNEARLQFYDTKNLHTKLDGDQILQISVSNANTETVLTRLYASKNTSVSVDQKGDNIITVQMIPIYKNRNLKFSRTFFPNATESVEKMIEVLYLEKPLLAPKITGVNIHVPVVPWVLGITDYFDYIRDVGLSVASDSFPFVWEDIYGIHLSDFQSITAQEPSVFVVGEPSTIGQFADQLEYPLAYDFNWLAKSNSYNRDPFANATIYTYSMIDKNCTRIVTGNGENSVSVSRSGGYADQIYRNGYEEATRISTMSQYDSYAECKTYGDFTLVPGKKLEFYDQKNQFLSSFFIDEVIHEITNNSSVTNMYMFSNSKHLTPVDHPKVKNELKSNSSTEESDNQQ
ncbi:baseplate hub subunit [Providencia phage PSTRCR_127]|nr:baseplate hub subunit [Providencia phage PSTRCR_127]QQV89053.1 baseplate hub subunit [Providencia phage PSTRCR_121]